jgi:hypothetical protein
MNGPVQVLVVGFEEPSLSGEILAELTRLGDAGVVRLLDVLLVSRNEDGGLVTLPPPPGAGQDLGELTAAFLETESEEAQPDSDPNVWSLDEAVPPGGVAAVALIEHTWAQPLVGAIRRAGGQLLDETWLAPPDLDLLGRLAGEARKPRSR